MNVLTFVMCILMLLTLMTYGRLEMFRGFSFVQAQFKEYMEKTERNYLNEQAIKRYEDSPATTKEKTDQQQNKKNPASALLSFNLFIDKEQRALHQADLEPHLSAAKSLMTFLYGDQEFFKKAEENRPDFLNEILNALMESTNGLLPTVKLKKTEEIATIDLGDSELNEIFTRMLKGSVEEVVEESKTAEPSFKPERGYYSLLDFITIQSNKLKIRVFLASPQVLISLYGNLSTVRSIVDVRYRLFSALRNESTTAEAAAAEFKAVFQNQQLPSIPDTMLDFGVSKTNPRTY